MVYGHYNILATMAMSLLLSGCVTKGTNPADPYESVNRKVHRFNMAVDATLLKPIARVYTAILPPQVRKGIDNAYNNVDMLPTIANDLLQAEGHHAIKDTWRFLINSTLGLAGFIDTASTFGLTPHNNDLGITFAKWGDQQSPYIVIPLLGPSTFRDGMGMIFDYALFTPYPWIEPNSLLYGLLGVRYVDLRSQLLETEHLMDDAMDKYTFIRDAYLQHRHYLITGEQQDTGELYVDDQEDNTGTPKPSTDNQPSDSPLTTAKNVTHSPATT